MRQLGVHRIPLITWLSFCLQRDVVNSEPFGQHVRDAAARNFGIAAIGQNQMRSQAGVIARNRPKVQVMHICNAVLFDDGRPDRS